MRSLISVAALGLVLGGCATGGSPTPLPPPEALIVAPEPIPGRDWHLTQHHGQSSLAFGAAESDDLDLGLTCEDGSGRVSVFRNAAPGEPNEIRLEAGSESADLAAEGEPSPLTDGLALSAETDAGAPVLRRFGDLGWLTLRVAGERYGLAAHPGSESRITRFLSACG